MTARAACIGGGAPGGETEPGIEIVTEPVYRQLARLCRGWIVGGGLEAGARFPSERELAGRYGVSRSTANKVISAMVAEGLLLLEKGVGTTVAERRGLQASLREMESFTSHARSVGMEPETRVLAWGRMAARDLGREVACGLGLGRGGFDAGKGRSEPVLYFERLRLADGCPMVLEHRWVLARMLPGLRRRDLAGSFYRLLEERYGLPMSGEEHRVAAVLLDEGGAKRLGTAVPAAALLVEGTGFVRDREPVWFQRLFYRGDRYQLHNSNGSAGAADSVQLGMKATPTAR